MREAVLVVQTRASKHGRHDPANGRTTCDDHPRYEVYHLIFTATGYHPVKSNVCLVEMWLTGSAGRTARRGLSFDIRISSRFVCQSRCLADLLSQVVGTRGVHLHFWWSQPSGMFYVGTDGRAEQFEIATSRYLCSFVPGTIWL